MRPPRKRDPLDELADIARIDCQQRDSFLAAVRYVLAEHEVAARDLDGNPLRRAADAIELLAARLHDARAALGLAERASGVTDLASWGDDLPTREDLERQVRAVDALLVRAKAPGRPTSHALSYTLGRLLEIHEQHEGVKMRAFVNAALKLIGVAVSVRKIDDAERWRRRRERLATAQERAAYVRSVLGK